MLKFNIKEHKLEELEKYGFIDKDVCYSYCIEDLLFSNTHPSYLTKQTFITISKITMNVLFIYVYKLKNTEESKNNIVCNGIRGCENLEFLYDLIKNGLLIKEE